MKRKTTTLLLGIAAIAVLGIAYQQLRSYNEKEEEAALEEVMGEEILNVDTNSLSQVSFYINGQEKTFSKKETAWILERDETFPVNADQILLPAEQLSPLQAVRILENPGELSEYGLDDPQNKMTLTDEEGNVTTVTIGDINSATENAYLMLNDEESTIYTIETTILSYFSDDLYDYAYSDEMPTLQVSDIIGASVESGTGGYELYLEDAKWAVRDLSQSDETIFTSEAERSEHEATDGSESDNRKAEENTDKSMSADQDLVNDAMSALGSLTYADYVEHNCTDDTLYGFEETDTILTIIYQVEVETEEVSETEAVSEEVSEAKSSAEKAESTETNETEISTEEETETETPKEERSVSFKVGTTDSLGNYYVQMVGSAEVHTLSSSVLDHFLGKTMEDWKAAEEEEESELQESESEVSAIEE